MKMYSIFLSEEKPSSSEKPKVSVTSADNLLGPADPPLYLTEYIIRILRNLSVNNLKMMYRERGPFPSGDVISVVNEPETLKLALTSLAKDECYFTMGWPETILIIPFEGWQFNLIVSDRADMPVDPLLKIMDSTEILRDYPDAYEGFGIEDLFPGEAPAPG